MSERLPYIAPDKPSVYEDLQVSYGVAPILSTFSNLSTKSTRPLWSLYMINVETLIRNRKEDMRHPEHVAKLVLSDMQVLAHYIAAYNALVQVQALTKRVPIICFYFGHYENLPKAYIREKFPKGTEERWIVRDVLEKIIQKEPQQNTVEDTSIVYALAGLKGTWPHKDVVEDLAKITDGLQFRKMLMISHVPIDFHVYRTFQEFNLLESYTGTIKNIKMLGPKVFKDDNIPFNKYTHLLLGDKWYMKSLIDRKQHNRVKEKATKEHWALIPDKAVLASIIQMSIVPSDLLIKPNI